jgi:hypothetical protein
MSPPGLKRDRRSSLFARFPGKSYSFNMPKNCLLRIHALSLAALLLCGSCSSTQAPTSHADVVRDLLAGVRACNGKGSIFCTQESTEGPFKVQTSCIGDEYPRAPENLRGKCLIKKCLKGSQQCTTTGSLELEPYLKAESQRLAKVKERELEQVNRVSTLCNEKSLKPRGSKLTEWALTTSPLLAEDFKCLSGRPTASGEEGMRELQAKRRKTHVRFANGSYQVISELKFADDPKKITRHVGSYQYESLKNGNVFIRSNHSAECRWFGFDGKHVHGLRLESWPEATNEANYCQSGLLDVVYSTAAQFPGQK